MNIVEIELEQPTNRVFNNEQIDEVTDYIIYHLLGYSNERQFDEQTRKDLMKHQFYFHQVGFDQLAAKFKEIENQTIKQRLDFLDEL